MGRIHPEADSVHFAHHMSHRAIVKPFLSGFDVTRGFMRVKGADRIACFYLKPEPVIAELVGLERELLLTYVPYPELQARALKLHDEVLHDDRVRLDPLGSVLVCDDPKTRDVTATFLSTEPEHSSIVALSTPEVTAIRDADGLRTILFRQLFQRDLFGLESPLRTDTTFFGRDDITNQLLDRARAGQNSGLFGLRRIGKTSVLYALRRRAETGRIAASAFLDVSNPSIYKARWWELLQAIIKAFAEPLGLVRGDRSKIRALTIAYSEADGAAQFKADIQALSKHAPEDRHLLLLDEVELITFGLSPSPHWVDDSLPFWQTLRAVHQDTMARFVFVVAGVNPSIIETERIGKHDNPLFSTVKPFYLSPFDSHNLRQMVRRIGKFLGLRIEESLYARLMEDFGGHPFLVRQACSHLAKALPDRPAELTTALYEKHRASIVVSLDKNARQVLSVLATWYPDEYEMLRLLAHGDVDTFLAFARDSPAFTEHVEGYGLVSDARTTPKLCIGLVAAHLRRVAKPHASESARASEKEAVLVEVSRRRNAIEVALRRTLHDGLRFGKGPKAADAVLTAIPTERRALLVQHGYDEIWQHLYFLELSAVVDKHWDDFARFFATDRAKVLLWLDHVNRCRSDAHARGLSEDDLAYLRVCFKRLEESLGLL